MIKIRQIPGKRYTFIKRKTGQKDTGILPNKCGESNSFARWSNKVGFQRGGCWTSKLFTSEAFRGYYKGTGPSGLLGRMKHIFAASKKTAMRDNHKSVKTKPEDMLKEWEAQKGLCALCEGPLSILKAQYDHNHETGEGRGFVHYFCNAVDGFLERVPEDRRSIILDKLRARHC